MVVIYQTGNFIVESADHPHITRADGGHIRITPKIRVVDRQHLSPEQAKELMMLTVLVGEAMTIALKKRGVDIGRINYQDNSNWSVNKPEGPYLHMHLYGRARDAKIQKWGEALHFPQRESNEEFYVRNQPLTEEDVREMQQELKSLLKKQKYRKDKWI